MHDIVQAINRETEQKSEKLLDERLWSLWLHHYLRKGGEKPYGEWKKEMLGQTEPKHKQKAAVKVGTEESMARSLEIANNTLRKIRQSTERR